MPVPAGLYGESYFEHYRVLDQSGTGRLLNAVRLGLVDRHWDGHVTDIGIGGGGFIIEHGDATGWDINERAVRWLRDRDLFLDPRSQCVEAATFWDSIEHMRDPSLILGNVERWAFISTPIYLDGEHALRSKHFKPGEHFWYFTEDGLSRFMHRHGFTLRESNAFECDCGRVDIGSFAFERIVTP